MAISTCSSRLLLAPAPSSRAAAPAPPRPAAHPTRLPSAPASRRRSLRLARPLRAYISAPAPGPDAAYAPPSLDAAAAAADVAAAISSSDAVTWAGVWALLSRHRARIAVCLAALLACTTCTLSMPLFSGRFFETLIGRGNEPLGRLLSKIAVLYTLEPIFTIIFVVNMTVIWEQVMARLRSQIFRRILIQKMVFFDRHKVGELTGLLTSDLGSLKNVVSDNISRDRGLRALSEITGTLCILFTLSTELAPVLGLLMVSVSVLVALFKRSTVPTFKSYGIVQARISDCASETFSAIRTVRTFGGEKRQISFFDNLARAYQNSGTKLGVLKSANESLTRVVVYVSLLALYILGGSKGKLSVGTMASFIGYTFTLTFAVQGAVNTLGDLRGTLASVERINSILSANDIDDSLAYGLAKELDSKELEDSNGGVYENGSVNKHFMSELKSSSSCSNLAWSGDIHLKDVHFSYPLRSDVEVLNGLDLTIECGKVTALVGPSGAGKSTVVQLLARYYEPTQGCITVAGEDVRIFDKREWSRVVSLVNQDPVLFSVSVGENIAYGLPDDVVSKDDIVKAAKAANAHEFIISLPQGYDTLVGERGSLLSGGQRQRIAIARALLKNAPILILDEATSALDTTSERLVQEALNHLMKGRTSLVIAHRLSTVQNAHRIAVCSEGKITELGTHAELVAKGGSYASLVGTQRLAFE
ncbi:ABC transporter B family member 28-like isoform X2 [Panicum virgatum]|uniref:ABC transporter B family member 28-like isoform X2 n=1 Tax=Panicum virgatum TaxID=38727 RepID=UPI0019D6996A|nr:ABC transporter B family member 28-like isoform X2 [Panicum virgatum]